MPGIDTVHWARPDDPSDERAAHNPTAINGMESLILACHKEGIPVESDAFYNAVQTTLDKISNELGE